MPGVRQARARDVDRVVALWTALMAHHHSIDAHWRIAAGSADEVRAALLFAEALGDIAAADTAEALQLLDRVLAMLWKMTN